MTPPSATERRQQLLAMILPAMLVGVGYTVFVGLPAEQALAKLKAAAERGEADAAELAKRARQRKDERRMAELDERFAELEAARDEARSAAGASVSTDRAEQLARLAELFQRHRLTLLSEEPTSLGKLEPALQQLATWSADGRKATAAREDMRGWRVEVRGRYMDVQAALAEVARADGPIVVSLALDAKDPSAAQRRWTVILWT